MASAVPISVALHGGERGSEGVFWIVVHVPRLEACFHLVPPLRLQDAFALSRSDRLNQILKLWAASTPSDAVRGLGRVAALIAMASLDFSGGSESEGLAFEKIQIIRVVDAVRKATVKLVEGPQ